MMPTFREALNQKKRSKSRTLTSDDLIDIHHEMMSAYKTWIPPEEFLEMGINTVINLMERIKEDKNVPTPVIIMGTAKKK